jgi:fumarate hydratase subunit beta
MTTYKLDTPISEKDARKLNVGDLVYITGNIFTARDQAHRRILEYAEKGKTLPVNLDGAVIYHCGPIMKQEKGKWVVVAAGPTTSTRMESSTPKLLEKFKVRMIIGKGGMGPGTTKALQTYGAVFCHFTGGAAVLAAKSIKEVQKVEWLDLGMPEALWAFNVNKFGPVVVTIDSRGRNFYEDVKEIVNKNLENIQKRIG